MLKNIVRCEEKTIYFYLKLKHNGANERLKVMQDAVKPMRPDSVCQDGCKPDKVHPNKEESL